MSTTTFTVNIPSEGLSASVQLKIVKKAKDIIMFVAGTTDPINITGLKHEANKEYWRDKKHQDNLWASIKKLKPQYLDLHIEDEFFSWSGDNNHEARLEAAERLLDLFLRVYSGWLDKDVCLHLIGHSHGGNVINEFTNVIVKDKKFPAPWKIKSITYLSTPFFKKQHQLNHTHLHEECKIINVHNEYDITQRFVADFTLRNLEYILSTFDSEFFNVSVRRIRLILSSGIYIPFKEVFNIIDDTTEGPLIWKRTALLLEDFELILNEIIGCISSFKSNLKEEKGKLLLLFNEIKTWTQNTRSRFEGNSLKRSDGYSTKEFIKEMNYLPVFKTLNKIMKIDGGLKGSFLLGILADIFEENRGLTYCIDNTSWTPIRQVKDKFPVEDLDITIEDDYNIKDKKEQFESFAFGVENSLQKNDLREVLMRLFSQFISPNDLSKAIGGIGWLTKVLLGEADVQFKELKGYLSEYNKLVTKYNADLVSEKDKPSKVNNEEEKFDSNTIFKEQAKAKFDLEWKRISECLGDDQNKKSDEEHDPVPGTIPYLAIVSHSLSHTKFWKEVETGLRGAFVSGKNPGYKV